MALSTIHGLKYLTKRCSKPEKWFWIISLVLVTCMFFVLTYETVNKFFSDQTVIKLSKRQYEITEVPYPAITICPEILLNPEGSKDFNGFYELLGLKSMQYKINYSVDLFFADLKLHTQSEWFNKCVFGEWTKKYRVPFSTVLTKHGYCFTFNMQPAKSLLHLDRVSEDFHYKNDVLVDPFDPVSSTLNSSQPWHLTEDTKKSTELLLKFYSSCNLHVEDDRKHPRKNNLLFYNSTNILQPNNGLLWILHSPNNFPTSADQRSYLKFLAYNDVIVELDMFLIDDELKSWSPEKRNCYLPGEKNLKFFKIYAKANCEQECLSHVTSEKCGCVPFYMIRGPETRICGTKDMQCYKTVEDDFHATDDALENCKCFTDCEFIEYRMNCEQYTGEKSTIMGTVSYENHFHPLVKQKAISRSEFFGSFGGLMGLVAGMSLLSIIELLLVMLFSAIQAIRNHTNRNKVWAFKSSASRSKKSLLNKDLIVQKLPTFISKFISKSSIHGLQNIADKEKKISEKVAWTVIASASTVFCLIMIRDVTKRSELNPIEFDIDEKIWSLNDVPFPAVTICPDMNMDRFYLHKVCMKKNICSRLDAGTIRKLHDPLLGPQEQKPMQYLCRQAKDLYYDELAVSKKGSRTEMVAPILDKMRIFSRPEIIQNETFCYKGLPELEFSEILTKYGVCFIFNFDFDLLNRESVSQDFLRSKKWTASCKNLDKPMQSKTLTLNFRLSRLNKCLKIMGLLSIQDLNGFEFLQSANLMNKLFSNIIFKPQITTTDEGLRKYSPEVRNCLFEDENHLKYFTKYSQASCFQECRSNLTFRDCNCVPFYVIRGNEERICNHEDRKCTNKIKKNLENVEHEDYKSCKCLPECNHIIYHLELFHERFTVENQSKFEEQSAASLRFDDDEFVSYRRYESYGSVALLSNIGGLLGLFLGVSVLSIIETIYFFTLRLFNDIWRKARC